MPRIPKPGDRLLPKDPTGSVVARIGTTDSADLIFTAPEARITKGTPGGMAVAMWVGSEENVCYVDVPALDEDSYVFADEFDEIITTDINEIRPGDFVAMSRFSRKSMYTMSGIVDKVEIGDFVYHKIYMKDSEFAFEVPTTRKATYSIRRKKPDTLKPNSVVIPRHEFLAADSDGYTYKAPIGVVSSEGTYVLADWKSPTGPVPCMSVEDIDMSSIKEDNK